MVDPFASFAESAMSEKAKAYRARKDTKQPGPVIITQATKREAEKRELTRAYRKYRADVYRALLAEPNGRDMAGLRRFIVRLKIDQASSLLHHLRSLSWLSTNLGREQLQELSRMIQSAIARVRMRAGLEPFDDGFPDFMSEPGTPQSVAIIIKDRFRVLIDQAT